MERGCTSGRSRSAYPAQIVQAVLCPSAAGIEASALKRRVCAALLNLWAYRDRVAAALGLTIEPVHAWSAALKRRKASILPVKGGAIRILQRSVFQNAAEIIALPTDVTAP